MMDNSDKINKIKEENSDECQDCQNSPIGMFYVHYLNPHWEELCLKCSEETVYSAFKPIPN